MAATTQTQSVLQMSRDWFSRPLEFMPVESGDLYVHFHYEYLNNWSICIDGKIPYSFP